MSADRPGPNRPASKEKAPDPSDAYERSHPHHESGQGRLDNNDDATPADQPDRQADAAGNRQHPRQVNSHETVDNRADRPAGDQEQEARRAGHRPPAAQPDHSMLDEEFLGEDQFPPGHEPGHTKRHPRTGGKGGTPDSGEPRHKG
jgi:hypothetical protein